jgi:hypothetical protein
VIFTSEDGRISNCKGRLVDENLETLTANISGSANLCTFLEDNLKRSHQYLKYKLIGPGGVAQW